MSDKETQENIEEQEEVELTQLEEAERLTRTYAFVSSGIGLVPIPVVDMLGVGGTQIYLVKKLSDHYDVRFKKSLAKSMLRSVFGI